MIEKESIKLSKLQTVLFDMIKAAPTGIGRAALVAETKRPVTTIDCALNRLKVQDLIVTTGVGCAARWCLPGLLNAAIADIAASVDRTASSAKAAEMRRYRDRKKAEAKRLAEESGDTMPIVHIIVSAADAKPLRVKAVRSVFELGAM